MTDRVKEFGWNLGLLRPIVLGLVLGVLGASYGWSAKLQRREAAQLTAERQNWPPAEFHSWCDWSFVRVDQNGWSTGPVGTYRDLDNRLARPSPSAREIVMPVFPSVFTPKMVDKLYYDALLESDIKPGDKVLVIGAGSGADAWVASLKSLSTIYVVEINPMAVTNIRATARIGNFQVKAVQGDIRTVALPDEFRDFDFVLWNMPFLTASNQMADNSFHDGDDGGILQHLLKRLPSLLKKGGQAILLNDVSARDHIKGPGVTTKVDGSNMLFIVPNP